MKHCTTHCYKMNIGDVQRTPNPIFPMCVIFTLSLFAIGH